MILYSWNVNGLRAVCKKPGFWEFFNQPQIDVLALQETRAAPEQLSPELLTPSGYTSFFSSHLTKKGYSGVGIYSRTEPISVSRELPVIKYAQEGRLLHAEYPQFHFLNIYFPNGQSGEERLKFKLDYYEAFLKYCQELRKTRPVVVCGDFNTAHRPIDLARPEENEDYSGFLPEERAFLDRLIESGYLDTFRVLNGDIKDQYSWWSFKDGGRRRNIGWRIDYFFTSEELKPNLVRAWLEPKMTGSDHCPVGLELEF
ncbi:MAG: exodeoxyribonuclease III [Deltaproteobacteria bacterium]|jgi:exodeoxyribonuclease-3|nr:exodeoxyribonuclease III [Deltaproteobacteria bacterium]